MSKNEDILPIVCSSSTETIEQSLTFVDNPTSCRASTGDEPDKNSQKMSLVQINSTKPLLLLFDIDGTLTQPRKQIDRNMLNFMLYIKRFAQVGLVGGSDIDKLKEQLGSDIVNKFEYVFAENGLVAYRNGKQIHKNSLTTKYTEYELQLFINYCLKYIADLDLPVKRGTFIEFRNGMINISPIGRNCSQAERDAFELYDKVHCVRECMINKLKEVFFGLSFVYSIGGQISFDVFPHGWDKTYCLQFIKNINDLDVHFFGDKTWIGGNDYEIYVSMEIIGHTVRSPEDTRKKLTDVIIEKYNSNPTQHFLSQSIIDLKENESKYVSMDQSAAVYEVNKDINENYMQISDDEESKCCFLCLRDKPVND